MQTKHSIFLILGLLALSVAADASNASSAPVATSDDNKAVAADPSVASPAQWDPSSAASLSSTDTPTDEFNAHEIKYKRKIHNNTERRFRYMLYKKSDEFIKNSTKDPNITWEVDHNQFSDMTDEEINSIFHNNSDEDSDDDTKDNSSSLLSGGRKLANTTPLSKSYNNVKVLRKNLPYIPPVRNQGSCGNCWTFSIIGAVESALMIKRATTDSKGNKVYPKVDLSEQQLNDCANRTSMSTSYNNSGCDGGRIDEAARYIIKYGLNTESEYPHKAKDLKCNKNLNAPAADTKNFVANTIKKKSMKSMLDGIKVAPVACALYVTKALRQYKSGIYDAKADRDQNTDKTNHAVLCTGFDTTGSVPYIEIKNSWGAKWGDEGYFKMRISMTDGDSGPANLLNHTKNTYMTVKK